MALRVPIVVALALACLHAACLPVEWGANAILHPYRRKVTATPPIPFEDVAVTRDGITLRGWRFPAQGVRRGMLVYLHGSADNRASGIGFAQRFVPQGFDVVAYDSRAHGDSGGKACTYGYFEKRDLAAVLDATGATSVVAFGTSLGGAVALQAAAEDPRIVGVITLSAFADLETVVRERAPFFATRREVDGALRLAEQRGGFRVSEVSPRAVASRVRAPVLVIHGARDRATPPSHAKAIFDSLAGPKELLLVPDRGHDDVLADPSTWSRIDAWLDGVMPPGRVAPERMLDR